VNARERLRAYLEQRRELGESEMTLDALDVDDVLRVVGALATAPDSGAAASSERAPSPAPDDDIPAALRNPLPRAVAQPADFAPPTDSPRDRPVSDADTGDWRTVLKGLEGTAAAQPAPIVPPPPVSPDVPTAPPVQKGGTLRVEGIVVPLGLRVERAPALPGVGGDWPNLETVSAAISACRGCGLVGTATQPVPGIGNPDANVMVVGEAPGEREDLTGEPFVGPAGELLTKILGAIQLQRSDVFICNVLKHRPPGNRNPMPDEVRACAPFLQRQIDLVQPKIILAFGTFAAQSLLGTKLAIGKLRQQMHWYQGIPLVATYHPAALLRNDAWKRPTWEDVKLARRVLDATIRT
jgi:uracil-DNA glycosylase